MHESVGEHGTFLNVANFCYEILCRVILSASACICVRKVKSLPASMYELVRAVRIPNKSSFSLYKIKMKFASLFCWLFAILSRFLTQHINMASKTFAEKIIVILQLRQVSETERKGHIWEGQHLYEGEIYQKPNLRHTAFLPPSAYHGTFRAFRKVFFWIA